MATIADILISTVFGGMMMLIMLTANDLVVENAAVTYGDRLVQESIISISQMVEGDFRNMGFGVPDSQRIVLIAEPERIRYRIDLPPFGSMDSVTYYLGPVTELAATMNERDRILYRRQNNATPERVGTVTQFRLDYVDKEFSPMAAPLPDTLLARVFQVEVVLEVQNPQAPYRDRDSLSLDNPNGLYSSLVWKQSRLALQNLDR